MKTFERLIQYTKYNTQSDEKSTSFPSTRNQLVLGNELVKELISLGVNASIDDYGYVIGKIASNIDHEVKTIALFAHMDTSPDASGEDVTPRIIRQYDGSDIILNEDKNIILSPKQFPSLNDNKGHDLIVTNGLTLLGADDKAGLAEIMTFVEFIHANPEFKHGEIVVCFTPDEEVGRGTDFINMNSLGADVGYTMDGSRVGEIAFENFNAASASLKFNGVSVHPGGAKNTMINSVFLAYEFDSLLPKYMRPETTEKYEGFNHLTNIHGHTEFTEVKYIIRNHSKDLFEKQKIDFLNAQAFMKQKYGYNVCELTIEDSYYNMREIVDQHKEIVDFAIEAIKEAGLTPIIEPIRGGTDGARLTYMGLPCPNLGTGGYNYHGPYEYASIQEMDLAVEVIKKLVQKFI